MQKQQCLCGEYEEKFAVPAEFLWPFLKDPHYWRSWQPDLQEVRVAVPLQEGTAGKWRRTSAWGRSFYVDKLEPERKIALRFSYLWWTIFAISVIEPAGEGCVVRFSLEVQGLLSGAAAAWFGRKMALQMGGFLQPLRQLSEMAQKGEFVFHIPG
ncbi:SRPBCC family protein [Anaeroarcus burkinensis]|uniref:SRPBCC family protein n=1 Tax=Anaeroarcus burkinensis TaxID=82376 RepID=UPI00040AD060|nr:SRPBCC family protein [Anaeroarcus burkinensis]